MDLIKNLTNKKLKGIKATLNALEFYGLSEEDIRGLPKLLEENKRLKSEINALEERIKRVEKSLVNLSDPDTQLKKQITNIARDCFTLPEDE